MRTDKDIVRAVLPFAHCERYPKGRFTVMTHITGKNEATGEFVHFGEATTARGAWHEARLLVLTPVRNIKHKEARRLVRAGYRRLNASFNVTAEAPQIHSHIFTCAECGRQYTVHGKGPLDCFFAGLCFDCITAHKLTRDEIVKVLRNLCYNKRQLKG